MLSLAAIASKARGEATDASLNETTCLRKSRKVKIQFISLDLDYKMAAQWVKPSTRPDPIEDLVSGVGMHSGLYFRTSY